MSDNEHVHLREYIERILDEREKAVRLTAANLEARLDHLNELRSEVLKDRNQFLSKAVYDQMHDALTQRVGRLENSQSRLMGVGIAIVAGAGFMGAILNHLFNK